MKSLVEFGKKAMDSQDGSIKEPYIEKIPGLEIRSKGFIDGIQQKMVYRP
jgi:hypothetical protein